MYFGLINAVVTHSAIEMMVTQTGPTESSPAPCELTAEKAVRSHPCTAAHILATGPGWALIVDPLAFRVFVISRRDFMNQVLDEGSDPF